jgi:hypothetical protein
MKGDTSKTDARARAGRVEDRPKLHDTPAPPALHPAYAKASSGGGGKGKLVAGGAAGLVLGTIVGGLTATFVAVKSVKKLLTLPFK